MSLKPAAAHTPAYAEATLTTCDAEPIHVPGAIQPHGMLVALDANDPGLPVVSVSTNCAELAGVGAEEALGLAAADILGSTIVAMVSAPVDAGAVEPRVVTAGLPRGGALDGRRVDLRVHRSGERIIVELEPLLAQQGVAGSYRSARSAMARLAGQTSMAGLTDLLASEVKTLTGFDRVMVYRFDDEWNGEVAAEARRADLNPFLGLHYPASDIPAQARRLYALNPVRLIADVSYLPVPLHPLFDPASSQPLDLSFASLRSVSPIHIEYLSNMGVTASMSISILVDDQLWGLIACHHYSGPHRPSHDARAAAEFVTQVASHLIAHRERADAREAAVETRARLAAITASMSAHPGSPLDELVTGADVLDLMGATGLALNFDGTVRTNGRVPGRHLLDRIAALTDDPDQYATHTHHLAGLDPGDPELAAVADVAAGVLRIGSAADRWLLWFRPEQPQVVDWGGDPSNKRASASEDPSVRLSPRRSFEKWREVTRLRSEPFAPWHLEAADELGRHTNSMLLVRSREQIAMAESMQRIVVLDRAPQFDGIDLTARYRPASTYQLGGDWWDAFELPDRRLALVVGDVAGHGVDAASAMTQVRTALRAYLYEGCNPGECLDQLDTLMDGLLGIGIATALVAVLDPASGHLEIASAGHPAPVVVAEDGTAIELDVARRPLLGVGAGVAAVTSFALAPDARVLFYTDGLVERRDADLGEQTARLLELAATASEVSLDDWADRLLASFDTTDDDTTLLALRRR